jgi:hypothetical protein
MIWLRFYYSERSGRRMIEDLDATLRWIRNNLIWMLTRVM